MSSGRLSLEQAKELERFGWVFNLVTGTLSYEETLMTLKGACLNWNSEVNADSAAPEACMTTFQLQEKKLHDV